LLRRKRLYICSGNLPFTQHFRNGDFDVRDTQRPGQPKKCEDFELQELLEENPAQTLLQLSKALNVTSKRLHAMGMIHKEGICLLHELSENTILKYLSIATSLFARQRKKIFYGAS